MPSGINVKEAMRKRAVTITPGQTALEAARLMRKEDIGSLVVVEGKKVVGIITREDINDKIAAKDLQASTLLVKRIMNAPVVSCSPDDDISAISHVMTKYGYERLPVIDKGKLVGIIATREIVKVAPAAIEIFRQHFEDESAQEVGKKESTEGDECERCGNFSEDLQRIGDEWLCDACREEEGTEE